MSSVASLFSRLPKVPDDRAHRAALLVTEQRRLDAIISIMPTVGRLAGAIERSEATDRYAEGIQQAYGKW